MIKHLKNRNNLIFAIIWFWIMIFDLINKNYGEALLEFVIVACSAEIYVLKQENKQLKMKSEEN